MNEVQETVAPDESASEGLTPGGVWLEARSLRKVYGAGASAITVLDGIDLSLSQGEMVAIVGPSGSGKSTLLHLLAALDTPTSGTVYFNAKALAARRSDPKRKRIASRGRVGFSGAAESCRLVGGGATARGHCAGACDQAGCVARR